MTFDFQSQNRRLRSSIRELTQNIQKSGETAENSERLGGNTLEQILETIRGGLEKTLDDVWTRLTGHENNSNNPHGVTSEQLNLGNVDNYATADQTQAEQGESNTLFMTPRRVKDAIVKQVLNGFNEHKNDTSNPHQVTKDQVGLDKVPNGVSSSRDLDSTNSLVLSQGMFQHKRSGDHDGRYLRKTGGTVDGDLDITGEVSKGGAPLATESYVDGQVGGGVSDPVNLRGKIAAASGAAKLYIVDAAYDGLVALNSNTGEQLHDLNVGGGDKYDIAVTPGGVLVMSSGWYVQVFGGTTGEEFGSYQAYPMEPEGSYTDGKVVAVDKDQFLYSGAVNGKIVKRTIVETIEWQNTALGSDEVSALQVLVDGSVHVGNVAGSYAKLDASTGNVLWTKSLGAKVTGISLRPDGYSAVSLDNGDWYVFDSTGAEIKSASTGASSCNDIALYPGDKVLVAVGVDVELHHINQTSSLIWAIRGVSLKAFNAEEPVTSLVVAADGMVVVSASRYVFAYNDRGQYRWKYELVDGSTIDGLALHPGEWGSGMWDF